MGATRRASASASSIASWADGPAKASVRGNGSITSTVLIWVLARPAGAQLAGRSRRTVPPGGRDAVDRWKQHRSATAHIMPSCRPRPGSCSGSPGRSGKRCCAETTNRPRSGDLGADRASSAASLPDSFLSPAPGRPAARLSSHGELFDQVVGADPQILGADFGGHRVRHGFALALGVSATAGSLAPCHEYRRRGRRSAPSFAGHPLRHHTFTDPSGAGRGVGRGGPRARRGVRVPSAARPSARLATGVPLRR